LLHQLSCRGNLQLMAFAGLAGVDEKSK